MLLVAPLTECLSIDEMAVVGSFLNVLGDLLALNSAYLSYVQDEEAPTNKQENQTDQNDYEVIQKSIEKIVSIIEPTLVAIMSIIIGGILIAVMLPLANIMSQIG